MIAGGVLYIPLFTGFYTSQKVVGNGISEASTVSLEMKRGCDQLNPQKAWLKPFVCNEHLVLGGREYNEKSEDLLATQPSCWGSQGYGK